MAPSFTSFLSMEVFLLVLVALLQMWMISSSEHEPSSSPRLPECVVDTCSDWHASNRIQDLNVDVGGCASVRHGIFMNKLKPNITGHWCKAWLGVQRCESKQYRYMVFRDDDTKLDIVKALDIAVKSRTPLLASYKGQSRHVITNWFILDTHSRWACDNMRRWWNLAQYDHPENDQKYFNHIFTCGKDGLTCMDKRTKLLNEVHCRSSLGDMQARKRLDCMGYQLTPKPELL